MKQINFKKSLLAITMMGSALMANAQNSHPLHFAAQNGFPSSNWYADYIGVRFSVTSPASIAGDKVYKAAWDGTGNEWGGQVTAPLINENVVMAAPDSSANAALQNGSGGYPSMAGNIALIYRGLNDFSVKAYKAQQAGAVACVIVNNIPGAPVGMGAGTSAGNVTIPVFMISQADGDAIRLQLEASQAVTMSITTWGQGLTDDLGFVPGGLCLSSAYAIPSYDLVSTNGNPVPIKNLNGAYIANYGSDPATNVKLKTTVQFTPTGSENATTVLSDSSSLASFPVSDSIWVMQTTNEYDLHPSGNGRYDFIYNLSSDFTDQYTPDNTASYSMYTTDNIYSKGSYDFQRNVPNISVWSGLSQASQQQTPEYTWGPLYYVATGGHAFDSLQFSIAADGGGVITAHPSLGLYIFKWVDGGIAADSAIEGGELTLVGQAQKNFDGLTDSSDEIFTVPVTDSNGNTQNVQITADANSWYYIVADVPSDLYLGVDGVINYYPRSYMRAHNGAGFYEMYSPINFDAATNLGQSGSDANNLVGPFAFTGGTTDPDSVVYSTQVGLVPAIPFKTRLATSAVKTVSKPWADVNIYPNPAVDNFNVSLGLDHTAKNVTYTVIDALANFVTRTSHTNVQNDNVSFSTQNMAAGTYYVTIQADGKMMTRKVTVIK